MDRHTFARLALSTLVLAIGLYAMLWLLSYASFGVHYPTGEPVQRSFDPVLMAALSIGAGILAGILLPYLPGQANHD